MSADRSALSGPELTARLAGGLWREVRVVARTGSTNDDLVSLAAADEPEGLVLVAEEQTAGRGRLDRTWTSPPRAGLTLSALLRPTGVPRSRWGWLPPLAGVALADAVGSVTGSRATLKWPNDLLVAGRKAAGILAAVAGDAAVVGIGLNVTTRADELPADRDDVTSLVLAGADRPDRAELCVATLERFAEYYLAWRAAAGDPAGIRDAYLSRCDTVGRPVSVALPTGTVLAGDATGIDEWGRLLVTTAGGRHAVAAGDVTHVRVTRTS